MSASLCLHVDGSEVVPKGSRNYALGWAVVGHFHGEPLERSGAHCLSRSACLVGHHEHVAFINGVLLAQELGVPLSRLTLVCDDDIFGYAPTWVHAHNYLPSRRALVTERLAKTVQGFFTPDVEDIVMRAFREALIIKIKGHQFEVYQERADYLAKHRGKQALGLTEADALPYPQWLHEGMPQYVSANEPPRTWHAPFVRNLCLA